MLFPTLLQVSIRGRHAFLSIEVKNAENVTMELCCKEISHSDFEGYRSRDNIIRAFPRRYRPPAAAIVEGRQDPGSSAKKEEDSDIPL